MVWKISRNELLTSMLCAISAVSSWKAELIQMQICYMQACSICLGFCLVRQQPVSNDHGHLCHSPLCSRLQRPCMAVDADNYQVQSASICRCIHSCCKGNHNHG